MKLLGKLLYFHAGRGRGVSGFRAGKIVRIHEQKKGIVALTVKLYDPTTDSYTGTKRKLVPGEWEKDWCGVLFHGKLIPVPVEYT